MQAITYNAVRNRIIKNGCPILNAEQILIKYVQNKKFRVLRSYQICGQSIEEESKIIDKMIDEIELSNERIALVVTSIDCLVLHIKKCWVLNKLCKQGKLEIHFIDDNLIIKEDPFLGRAQALWKIILARP